MAVSKKTLHLINVHKPNPVNCNKKYFEILINDTGTLHGLAYWFKLEYGWNIVVSNYHRDLVNGNELSLNKQAVITFKSPISMKRGKS